MSVVELPLAIALGGAANGEAATYGCVAGECRTAGVEDAAGDVLVEAMN